MQKDYRIISCDALVIGGGGAGMASAIAAARAGADVLLVSKGESGRSGATYYDIAEIGAYNAPDGAGDPTDNVEVYYEDMKKASLSMASLPLCQIMAEQSSEILDYIVSMPGGDTIFEKIDGRYKVFQSCFTSKPRAHVMHDHFRPLLTVLRREAKRLNIKTMSGITIADLFVKDGVCYGAYGFDQDGNDIMFAAKSVILAAGGASQLFQHNMYPNDIMGDSYAMALRAGAKMTNMEFLQMGIGMAHPFINLFENYLWESHPVLKNGFNERFLHKYAPQGVAEHQIIKEKRLHFPFSTRDNSSYVEIAIQKEITAGRGNNNGNITLDIDTPEFRDLLKYENNFSLMWKTTYNWYLSKGVDLQKEPIEISCFAHAINGGALIDENGLTSIEGLYAVGEAATGPHGADRLGGNMSVASQVFGRIAGQHSVSRVKKTQSDPDYSQFVQERRNFWSGISLPGGTDEDEILTLIKKESDRCLLVVRNESQMLEYKKMLQNLQAECRQGDQENAIDRSKMVSLYNLMETGILIARSAISRKESRGSHYREDYTAMDHTYDMNLIIEDEKEYLQQI